MSALVMLPEQWRPVREFEGVYEVSDFGRVRSLARVVRGQPGQRMTLTGRLMKVAPDSDDYDAVKLSRDGRGRNYRVHLLIAEAFIGPREDPEHEVRHLNGSRRANGLANLAWGTALDNVHDMLRHGHHHCQIKEACPLGHDLLAPNLTEAELRRGKRVCRACRRAHDAVRRAAKRGVTLDFTSLAHDIYQQIMAGDEPSTNSHVLAARNVCVRDHALTGPNFIRDGQRRRCLACRRARTDVRDARVRRGEVLDLDERADHHYRLIMGKRHE